MKRIVLFVEGEGDSEAVPRLVKRLLTEQNAWNAVFLDEDTFRVGKVNKIVKDNYREWKRKLAASLKRRQGGTLGLNQIDGANGQRLAGRAERPASLSHSQVEVCERAFIFNMD